MKTLLLAFLFTSLCYPQTVELSSTIYGLTSGYVEGWKLRDYMLDEHNLSEKWHNYQLVSRIAGVGTGVSIALDSDMKPLKIAEDLLIAGTCFWISHDIGYNSARGFNWFKTSKTTGSFLEQFNLLKIPLLLGVIILEYCKI